MDIKKPNEDNLETRKLLYTNVNGKIYEDDIVQCFDLVAWNITCLTGKELTPKMISNARVVKVNNKDC